MSDDNEPIFDQLIEDTLLPEWANILTAAINQLAQEVRAMATDAEQLIALTQSIQQSTVKIEENQKALQAEIAALKAQPAAAALDFSGLDAIATQLAGDATPAAPPAA